MYSTTVVPILSCFVLISSENIYEDLNNFPDYGYQPVQRPKDIRQSFIKNRKRNDETAKRLHLLDKYLPNNTIYIDGIAHFEINKNHSDWNKVNRIEKEFRNLIAMKGLKYTFKRDMFWRTWRLVHYPRNVKKVVFYKYDYSKNLTYFQANGYWVIEEKPPSCPYELFSISHQNKICAVHLNKYHDIKSSCSTVLNYGDLTGTCDNNPVVTEWHIEKRFGEKVPERFPTVICGGRESCTISTFYRVSADYISFQIVNTTNDIIYSRIMKQGKNYACLKDCGKINPYSKKTTVEKSLIVNLLGKNKREDKDYTNMNSLTNNHMELENKAENKKTNEKMHVGYRWDINSVKITTGPTCKTLKLSLIQDELDEDELNNGDR